MVTQESNFEHVKSKMKISAIVVGFNEGHLLSACLKSLSFCDEINYYDLGSKDNSLETAKGAGANIFKTKLEPYVEIIHSKYIPKLKNDWILFIDPDEQISDTLVEQITKLNKLLTEDPKIGCISVPIEFYFKQRSLKGTPWGYNNYRILIAHKGRFIFGKDVHSGRVLIDGYKNHSIKRDNQNVIHHFWMDSYKNLFKKHLRYLKTEGVTRFNKGHRTTINNVVLGSLKSFKYAFYHKKGYLDGFLGFFLSLFWVWYQTSAEISLLKHQQKGLDKISK